VRELQFPVKGSVLAIFLQNLDSFSCSMHLITTETSPNEKSGRSITVCERNPQKKRSSRRVIRNGIHRSHILINQSSRQNDASAQGKFI
jgi:hypothetical protein